MIQKREIVTCVLLTIVTCGIYGIIWFINLTDDIAKLAEDSELSGGKAFLFTLLTCGIYGIYWAYKIGKDIYEVQNKRNLPATDNSVLYLVLELFGLGIVTYCLAQSEVNKLVDTPNNKVNQI